MNNPNEFPLNLKPLQRFAKRWAAELPGIKDIRLYHFYHYSSFLEKEEIGKYKNSVKYAVVFVADNPGELWNLISDDRGVLMTLVDADFMDVYQVRPDAIYINDWVFTTSDLADGSQNSSVMVNAPYWTLFPATEEYQTEASGDGIEPDTKVHAYQVKKRWGIDKIKLAEYVWEDGLHAYDEYGRRIPTVEMLVDLKSPDMRNDPEKQKAFIADQIKFFISDDILNFEYDHDLLKQPGRMEPVKSFQDFINEAKENKMPGALIAVELKERYQLTYVEIACALNLDADLQPDQFDAKKQRARRLINKGKGMKAKSVTP